MSRTKFNRAEYTMDNGKLQAYAWPGGYPMYYCCADGEVLCAECATTSEFDTDSADKAWTIVGADVNYEDADMVCAHCEKQIEAAYTDDR